MMFSGGDSPRPELIRDVVAGDVGEQDALLLLRALADEALAEAELRWRGACAPCSRSRPGSAAPARRRRRGSRACRRRRAAPTPAAPAPTGSCSTTVARSRWPWSMRVKRSRLVFSQSCSVFCRVVSRRLRIISLSLSLRTATSPLASTPTCRVRSPSVTAVATSAIARTWLVRLAASWLTLSVRSFQTPATSADCAWPPSLPSTPTSRATRVTSEAKRLSWSTIALTVFLSSRNSPLTSAEIFLLRSPLATAVVTSAMLRTWPVRLPAIRLTLSVRSFQTPPTSIVTAAAWPSLPSVPTSRATRVTSEMNRLSWSTIALMVFLSSSISPCTSAVIFLLRSPSATAPITRCISLVGRTRSSIRLLTDSMLSAQTRSDPRSATRCESLPSLPTTRLTRASSAPSVSLAAMTSLSVSAILPATPVHSSGMRDAEVAVLDVREHAAAAPPRRARRCYPAVGPAYGVAFIRCHGVDAEVSCPPQPCDESAKSH